MEKLEVTFRIVTPLFLGGAKPNEYAELRPPSIKGAMRFWYRAIDSEFRKHEPTIFGGTEQGQGQAKFLLSITGAVQGMVPFTQNGMQYFSFPFNMGDNRRKYIREGHEFTLHLMFREEPDKRIRRSILASLWLLGHVGGLGSRSRRGFGTIAMLGWEADSHWPEMEQLSSAHQEKSVDGWRSSFQNNLGILKQWFPTQPQGGHLTLHNKTVFHLITNDGRGFSGWNKALAHAADIMQTYRDYNKFDYLKVKAHICKHDLEAAATAPHITPKHLSNAPERSSFGLPLTFRSSSLKYKKTSKGKTKIFYPNITFQGGKKNETRSGSRIFVRIVQIGNRYYPLYSRFDGALLSPGNKITDGNGRYKTPSDRILDLFMNKNLPKGVTISW